MGFDETIEISIAVSVPSLVFPLHLRVPAWCTAPKITINGAAVRCAFFDEEFTLEDDAFGSHACSLKALACVRPMAFLSGCSLSYRFTL